MKKPLSIFVWSVLLLGFCNISYAQSRFSHLEKNTPKEVSKKRVPPTEMMQIGIKTKKKYAKDEDSVENKRDAYIREIQDSYDAEIADSFIDDSGTYVGKYKIGNEYVVSGVKYSPQEYDNFEEVGVASWYGDAFHGKLTANGEIYHKGDMTAAHPTLPLPSVVRITNLDNGKSVKVRVNDRGPFSKKRVVDVSEKAAVELGFKNIGTANVKLEFLKEDTEEMLQKLGLEKNN